MNDRLAELLLAKVMNWEPDKLAEERFQIQLFADVKYDNYQKYSQGMRYVESLALWLNNFDADDRDTLYDFIKKELVFISELQMRNLVEMVYPFYVSPQILEKAISVCKEKKITDKDKKKEIYEALIRKTLFLGLSDGSHIDLFRRANPSLSHEQINVYYDVSKGKIHDMINEMPSLSEMNNGISCIYLLDDFSGSGISFIRKEDAEWKGKIVKFLKRLQDYDVDTKNIDMSLFIYVSTEESINYIAQKLDEYKDEYKIQADYSVNAIQLVAKRCYEENIYNLLKKYYDKFNMSQIEDVHYKKGSCVAPYLGFNSSGFPLVIFHNTPNNALPIIWFSGEEYSGLFPRVTRHKEADK